MSRHLPAVLLLLCLCLSLGACAGPAETATAPPEPEWTTRFYIGAGDAVSAVEQATGRVAWTAALPAGDANLFLTSGDELLVASVVDENPHSIGSGQLTALDRASGALRWGRALPSPITGLAVAGGLLLSSSPWAFEAYAPASGEPAWSYTTGEGLHPAAAVGEQVALADWAGQVSALSVTPAP